MSEDKYSILTGVRILELTTYVAAPSSGRILADWGADIIKVEATPKGDVVRFVVPLAGLTATPEEPLCFEQHNANKKSIVVDLKTPEGQEIMHKLLATANVILTNTRSNALKKLGMDYDSLSKKYPSLIHAQMTGYGEVGPMADDPGFDNVSFWALGGVMIAAMEKDTAPIIPPSAFGDNGIACTMAAAICAALYKQKCTGQGSKIVLSLYGQAIWDMAEPILSVQCGVDKYPKSRLETTPLNNTYKCRDDKWIMVCCHEYERYFPQFMKIINREELIHDDNINTFKKGNENCRQVIGIISEGFGRFTQDELDAILTKEDIPHAKLVNVPELLESKQAWDNEYLQEYTLPSGRKMVETVSPVKFGGPGKPPRKRAPYLGEQSSEILREVGYTDQQIQSFIEKNVVIESKIPK
jgi:crotonobetainyl-CoA:carnitine CoA-transferase CaiB-like acyl-CoA transferase